MVRRKSYVRICISSSGKPYLRAYSCSKGEKEEPIISNAPKTQLDITASQLPLETRRILLEKGKGFFGPDGKWVET